MERSTEDEEAMKCQGDCRNQTVSGSILCASCLQRVRAARAERLLGDSVKSSAGQPSKHGITMEAVARALGYRR